MATEAKNTNYWISSSALYIQLNAMGEPDYIQCSVVSGASILCYMQGIPGLEYDAGHNYQRWPLAAYPSVFPDSERKYIYVAIPRVSTAEKNTAMVVYPSERIDLYGYSIANPDKLVGDERFYYIYLQGIISEVKTDADGKTRKRDWLQHVDCGKLNTDESLSSGIDGTWWKYNSVTDTITFFKTILSATFDSLTANIAKITKLFLGDSELNGVANDLSLETDNTKVVTPLYLGQFGVKHFLAKDKDDVAHGTITFEKVQKFLAGLNVGDFNLENGGSWTPDAEGRSHLITDYLEVRMKAIFEELVIKKTSTIGGKEIISPAGGVVAHKVEEVTVTYNNVSQKAYRCYFLAEQEGDSVDNDFAVNDQVRSESFNVRKGTYHKVGNHFYWRLVIGRDEDPVELEGKKYHYIDLSVSDCATSSDVPAKGDVLSQCGNRTNVERQNCLIFSAVDTYSPSIGLYHGINSYSFSNKEFVEYGVNKQTNKAFFNIYGDMYVGDRPTKENNYEGSSYVKYDSATKQVVIKGKLSAKSTVDGKELSQYIKDNSAAGLTEEQVNNLINNSQVIADLQNQVDGAIETWFYEGVPTLDNAPASSWTTDKDKNVHLGDLYYDNKTGKAYRFAKDGSTYKWTIITDTDIAKALADASNAQETADGKMTVFATQPTPPYQVGDIWVNATYPSDGSTYKNDVLRCQIDKKAGSQFAIADWIKASKYTDDTVANAAKKAAEDAQKAAQTAQTNITNLDKTVTGNKKAFDNYVEDGYLEPSEIAAMAQDSKRLEDDFSAAEKSYNEVKGAEVLKNTKELTDLKTAFAILTKAKTELVTYLSDISARYNKADTNGKATIVSAVGTKFTNFQSEYSAFYDKLGLANAYITSKIYGDLKQNITDLAGYKYIKDALGQTTDIDGGLVMTTLLALRDADGNVQSGINGAIDENRGKKSIATWWGGQMVDKDYNSGSLTPATSLIRFDGSGYLANGAIWWDVDGKVHADPTSFIISEKNLGAYLTFFEPTWKAGSAGTSVADLVSLKPNAPFTKLGVSGDATFEGAISFHGIKLTYDATNKAIKVDGNLYATGGITAYGEGSGSSTGGGLNGSVKAYADAIKLTTENLSDVASAYSVAKLKSLIDGIDGSAPTEVDWSIIKNKPTTLAGYGITDGVNSVFVNGSGNAVTSAIVSGHTLTLTKEKSFLESVAWWNVSDTHNANDLHRGITFAYVNHANTATTGTLVDFSCGSKNMYSFQLQASYNSDTIYFRRNNGDNNTWGGWNRLATIENIPKTYAGSSSAGGDATRALKLKDYNGDYYDIYCGYSGASLNAGEITSIVGTKTNGSNVYYKDVQKSTLQTWLGLGARAYDNTSYLPLSGGTMSGIIKRSSGGLTIQGRDNAIIRQTYAPGSSSWNPIACVDTETGTWTLGHLSTGSSTDFNFCFSTDVDYNAGNNSGTFVSIRNKNGIIALTSEIPTKLSSLSNDVGYITSSGSCNYATSANEATRALKLKDYNGDYYDIYCGYSGASLNAGEITSIVGTKTNGSNVYYKDVQKSTLQTWLGLGARAYDNTSYLPLSGGTMSANARISHDGGNLYLGNSDNSGWVLTQDIASKDGADKWSIYSSGGARFGDIYLYRKEDGTIDTGVIERYAGPLCLNWNSSQDVIVCNGGGTFICKTNILSKGGITAYSSSDIRLKQDLRKLDYLGIIKAMGGTFGFAWKKDNTRSIGWIAQHVLQNPHLKDIVETDEKGYYKINYWSPKLIATAFGAIEQVGDEVSRLKARVVFLESEVQRLSGEQVGSDKKRLGNKNIKSLN